MSELGIDLSGQRSKHVREFEGHAFDYVITVCDDANESCPFFPEKPNESIGVFRTLQQFEGVTRNG